MTGLPAAMHGMLGNGESSKVLNHENTLPAALRKLGYQTYAVGKMHFSPQRARHGFDEIILIEDFFLEMERSGSPLQPMRSGLSQTGLEPSMSTSPETMTSTWWTAEKSAEFIRERRDPTRPFFLWTSFSKPHPPFDPPEPYYSMYRQSNIPAAVRGDWLEGERCPESFKRSQQQQSFDLLSPEKIREARSAYYGLITQIDHNIGRILEALHEDMVELFDNTLIMFTSDHGDYLGDHGAGGKKFFHEASAHLPMMLCLPKCWENKGWGRRVSTPVTLADIMPSLLHAAGENNDKTAKCMSLIDLARGTEKDRRDFVVGVGPAGNQKNGMVTNGKWKYIWWSEGGIEQLFNLEEDRLECHDLSTDKSYKKILDDMRGILVSSPEAQAGKMVKNGKLLVSPVRKETEIERRTQNYMAYDGEKSGKDVRH